MRPLGIYISVPFCKAKCTFCNFASDAFAPGRMEGYTERLCREIDTVRERAERWGGLVPESIDSLYFGGGTPSLLPPEQVRVIFERLRSAFRIEPCAEITLECAPGQLADETLEEWLRQGMNRISFGVQSFVDAEAQAVGRLHTRGMCVEEITRMRRAGVPGIGLDLIAGLPLQTAASWRYSVEEAIAAEVTHVSVYMLEVDEESRLGREALAQGVRYHAASLPTEEQTAEWYGAACNLLESAGIGQYEISNFAHDGHRSIHNLKYWRRHPYLGFGLDAHSMVEAADGALRFANTDDLDEYMRGPDEGPLAVARKEMPVERVGPEAAFEEALFLGLRLNEGVSLKELRREHGDGFVEATAPALAELCAAGLMWQEADRILLTAPGRLLSNEVFGRLLLPAVA